MKRLSVAIALIFAGVFLIRQAKAGLPLDPLLTNRTSQAVPVNSTNSPQTVIYPITGTWNTSIQSSSAAASGAGIQIVLPVVQATMTYNSGTTISSFTARTCITDITVSLSSSSTFTLLDGGTTNYAIPGISLLKFSGALTSVWEKHWDHLGPWCGTPGNTVTLNLPAPGGATANNTINVEGYTVLTGLAAVYNANQ